MHALTCPNAEFPLAFEYLCIGGGAVGLKPYTHPPAHKHATHTLSYLLVATKRLIRHTIIRACGTLRASTARQQHVPRCALARENTARTAAICVLTLLYMCPNTAIYLASSSYCYISSVFILLDMRPHTTTCVSRCLSEPGQF